MDDGKCTSFFNSTKYAKWYFMLIEKAKNRVESIKGEDHHILPRSLGGSDLPDNRVMLTCREHFIAHLLLSKAVNGTENQYKMLKAIKYMMLIGVERFGLSSNSKKYEFTKTYVNLQFAEAMSKFMKEQHCKFPEKFKKTLESRAKTSAKLKGENNGMFGRSHSAESKIKMGQSRIGTFGVFRNGQKKMIRPDEIELYFLDGWVPLPLAITSGKIDAKYLDRERFEIEFKKWKNSEKVPKSRVDRMI